MGSGPGARRWCSRSAGAGLGCGSTSFFLDMVKSEVQIGLHSDDALTVRVQGTPRTWRSMLCRSFQVSKTRYSKTRNTLIP